ncbi:MAG: DUF1501 domain-containing protein [Chitinophagaceae bacterium]|nr:DUF1501 domain-containing protein [Oligoflexus sp.]
MDRRNFLQGLGAAGIVSMADGPFGGSLKAASLPDRPLYINASCSGGWDVSYFCDPKFGANFPLNKFTANDLKKIGPFTLGPMSTGALQFFQKYESQIMLINGVYAETINHDVGNRLTSSGSADAGFPCFDALVAACLGPSLGLSFISGGGYDETGHIVAKSIASDSLVSALASMSGAAGPFLPADLSAVSAAVNARLQRKRVSETLDVRQRNMDFLSNSRKGWDSFPAVVKTIADLRANVPLVVDVTGGPKTRIDATNPIFASAQIALAGYVNNATVAANLNCGNCDQHSAFELHVPVIDSFFVGMDYFWRAAKYLGVADNVTLMMGSDFARTPYIDPPTAATSPGKAHWGDTTSVVLMGKHVAGGTLIGSSTMDASFRANPINPKTLKEAASGVPILRSHIHDELRRVAGIKDHDLAKKYPLLIHGGPIRLLG